MKKSFLIIVTILLSISAFSINALSKGDGQTPKEVAKKSEINFQLGKSILFKNLTSDESQLRSELRRPGECGPNGSSCIDAACSFMEPYHCDDIRELKQIGEACQGNFDGSCVRTGCSQLDAYHCDDPREVMAMAKACAGVTHGSCIDQVCSRMQDYQCDEPREIFSVIETCKNSRN